MSRLFLCLSLFICFVYFIKFCCLGVVFFFGCVFCRCLEVSVVHTEPSMTIRRNLGYIDLISRCDWLLHVIRTNVFFFYDYQEISILPKLGLSLS